MNTVPSTNDDVAPLDGYEPPRIEQVMTPAELTREILYAGIDSEVVIPIG